MLDKHESPEATWAHIVEIIRHAYQRPMMYAQTPAEFDSVLYQYHHLLGFIGERDDRMQAHAEVCRKNSGGSLRHDPREHEIVQPTDVSAFSLTLKHWQEVDRRIGLLQD